MFTISMDKECGCFKKSEFSNNMQMDSKDDALMQAKMMTNHMNSKFCQKHEFLLSENGTIFSIAVSQRAEQASGCCGGGHCS